MKLVLIDGIHLGAGMKGVGLYVANTLRCMAEMNPTTNYIIIVKKNTSHHILPKNTNLYYKKVPWRNHLWHGYWTIPQVARQTGPEVVWIPYEGPCRIVGFPYMVLCHDVPNLLLAAQKFGGQEVDPKLKLIHKLDGWLLRNTLRRAKKVFANSTVVAKWLEKDVGIGEDEILIAPCAPGADFAKLSIDVHVDSIRNQMDLPDGYLLTIFTGDNRENFQIVPKVYQRLLEMGFLHGLVIAGVRPGLEVYIDECLKNCKVTDRIRIIPFIELDKVNNLVGLYTAASVYFDPSLHEGFGMQVVEAMACGVPVVCSNRGALPEVAGGAAMLVNPENIDEMVTVVTRVLADSQIRQEMVQKGKLQASIFNWEKTAKVIYHALKNVARMRT